MDDLLDCVESHAVARIEGLEIKRFSLHFLAIGFLHPAEVRNLLREDSQSSQISNKTSDGLWFRASNPQATTEYFQLWIKLLFAQVGMLISKSPDFFKYAPVP